MKVGVLALQGAFREHREVLDALGVEAVEVAHARAARRASTRSILPGRRVHHDEQAARLVGLRDAARATRCADGLPVLGTCAGLILLAREVRRRPSRPAAVRRHRRHRAPQRLRPPARVVRGRRSTSTGSRAARSPACSSARRAIEAVGAGVEVLAAHDDVPVLVRVRARSGSSSFHPELSGDLRLHERFLSEVSQR